MYVSLTLLGQLQLALLVPIDTISTNDKAKNSNLYDNRDENKFKYMYYTFIFLNV